MNNCKQIPKKYTLLNNISLHILILFVILSSVFVFYISKVESDNINDQIVNYINKIDFNPIIDDIFKSNETAESNFVNNITPNCSTKGDSFPCDASGNDPLGAALRFLLNVNKDEIIKEITKINTPDDQTIKKYIGKILLLIYEI